MRLTTLLPLLALLASCNKITLVVERLPDNTPADAPLYVAGNFNYWDPADRTYRLEKNAEGHYSITLPAGWGNLAYKFTRGDWRAVETDLCGQEIGDRTMHTEGTETVKLSIESWKDLGPLHCPKAVLRIKKLPKGTPEDEAIYLASTARNWDPHDTTARFAKTPAGYVLTITQAVQDMQYKLTRGNWATEEVDQEGRPIENRALTFGKADTVELAPAGWKDIDLGQTAHHFILEVRVPPTTPPGPIYITGNFNKWKPGDDRYILQPAGPGLYRIGMTKVAGQLEYKITRGDWNREEVNAYGERIPNHVLRSGEDTVKLTIIRWSDNPEGEAGNGSDVKQAIQMAIDELHLELKKLEAEGYQAFPVKPGERPVRLVVRGTFPAKQLWVRFELPSEPGRRNYGFADAISIGSSLKYILPAGTRVYACDGKYWDDARPKERLAATLTQDETELAAGKLAY